MQGVLPQSDRTGVVERCWRCWHLADRPADLILRRSGFCGFQPTSNAQHVQSHPCRKHPALRPTSDTSFPLTVDCIVDTILMLVYLTVLAISKLGFADLGIA
jgi:hypothetical protein